MTSRLPNTPKDGALKYAERIRRLIGAFPFEGCQLTISSGIAAAPDDAPPAEFSGDRFCKPPTTKAARGLRREPSAI